MHYSLWRNNVIRNRHTWVMGVSFVRSVLPLWILFIHITYGEAQDVTFLLNGTTSPATFPQQLGEYPHDCVGNVNQCTNGFTIGLWFMPEPGVSTIPEQYLLSSGGQSEMSEGYYIRRNYGLEYEVGVAKNTTLWSVSFDLRDNPRPDNKVHVLFTWMHHTTGQGSGDTGLHVYIDGILVGSDSVGTTRLYTDPQYDTYREIWAGKANNDFAGPMPSEKVMYGIKHWSSFTEETEAPNHVDEDFLEGCVSQLPAEATSTLTTTAAVPCRKHCSGTSAIALLSGSGCSCYAPSNLQVYLASLESTGPCSQSWGVYYTSAGHAAHPHPINLDVTVTNPTTKGYTLPQETVVFHFNTITPEMVTFLVNFDDGLAAETQDNSTSHYWHTVGTYNVNVTAITRRTMDTEIETIEITMVDEGVKPEVDLHNSFYEAARSVAACPVVIGVGPIMCTVSLGDGTEDTRSNLNQFVNEFCISHTFDTVGLYDFITTCQNTYGSTSKTKVMLAVDDVVHFVTQPKNESVLIPYKGSVMNTADVKVVVNDNDINYSLLTSGILVESTTFLNSGEYLINIKHVDTEQIISSHLYNLQSIITGVTLTTNLIHCTLSTEISFVFEIVSGDHIYAELDYGDGTGESWYFPEEIGQTPASVAINHTLPDLGKYYVILSVGNDVSYIQRTTLISIERPIQSAQLYVHNVTYLGDKAHFTFRVDERVTPTMPFNIHCDFGDGNMAEEVIGNKSNTFEEVVYVYEYADYGIYRYSCIVSNNVTTLPITLSGIIQVGDNITYVDLSANKDAVSTGEELEITVHCPLGQPVKYQIFMGDDTVIEENLPPVATVAGSRRKRAAGGQPGPPGTTPEPSNTTLSTTPAPTVAGTTSPPLTSTTPLPRTPMPVRTPNQPLVVRHTYNSQGWYTVRVIVFNQFGNHTSWLSPRVLVIHEPTMPTCSEFRLEPSVATTESSPTEVLRSDNFTFSIASFVDCGNNYDLVYTADAAWRTALSTWRPELQFSYSIAMKNTFLVPALSLWYGLYELEVTAYLEHPLSAVRRKRDVSNETDTGVITTTQIPISVINQTIIDAQRRLEEELASQPMDWLNTAPQPYYVPLDTSDGFKTTLTAATAKVFLKVNKSPLIANIKGPSEKNVFRLDVITLDGRESHDPDVVVPTNRTGMCMHVVCYPDRLLTYRGTKNYTDFIHDARKVATNKAGDANFYDMGCFQDPAAKGVLILDWEVVLSANLLIRNDTLNFELIVKKDTRFGSATQRIQVLYSNETGVDLLNSIDALLASGNTGAALYVIDLVSNLLTTPDETTQNDTEAKTERTKVRGKLIGALGKVSNNLQNFDQIGKTTSVLKDVTTVKDEVSDDDKGNAAETMNTVANVTGNSTDGVSLDDLTDLCGDLINTGDNVAPTDDTGGVGPTTIVITTTTPTHVTTKTVVTTATTRTVTTETPFGVNVTTTPIVPTTPVVTTPMPTTTTTTTTMKPETTQFIVTVPPSLQPETTEEPVEEACCDRTPEPGLCEWEEPKCEFLVEDDRKKMWDNQTCDEVHPDDLIIVLERYRMYLAQQKRIANAKKKKAATNVMSAYDTMGNVLVAASGENSEVSISTPKTQFKTSKLDGSKGGSSNGLDFPSSALGDNAGDVAVKAIVSDNVYTYDDSSKAIGTKVKTFSFTDKNGKPIRVDNSSDPLMIWLDGSNDTPFTVNEGINMSAINYHETILLNNESTLHIIVIPQRKDDKFRVFLKYNDFPNETYYDAYGHLPREDDDLCQEHKLPSEQQHMLKHTFYPDSNTTWRAGTYQIGVQLTRTTLSLIGEDRDKKHVKYSILMLNAGCRFWDNEKDRFSTEGMTVGNCTTPQRVQCFTSHLTSFGGDFAVPPNTINFATVFSAEKFIEAVPVFVTVSLVLLIYLGGIIWARRMDKRDVLRWGAAPLEDNLPTDSYHYQITMNTGVKKGSGTTSKVSFILSGDDSDTGVRRLADGKRKELPTGSILNYVMSVEGCLGPLTYLRVWHDNTGKGKKRSWFLGQVQVVDLQTGEKFFFLCDRWLAVEEDDGMVERIVPVAGMNDLTAFKHLFNSSVRKKLTNDHLWVSIMSRPTRSNFTRVQRLSCCVSLLFLTMISNCMFFRADEGAENVSSVKVGPLSFTLHQLFISVVTTAIVFPPNMLIVIIFRKARAKKNAIMHLNQQKSKKFRWRTFSPGSSLWNNVQKTRTQKFRETIRNIMTSHQKAKYEESAPEGPLTKKKKKRFTLPHWTMYIAWAMITVSILGSGFFTILYSMEWGREKSLDWLSTFLLSFFQSVIVVQPVKVLLLAAFISCVLRKPDIDDEEADFDENNAGPAVDDNVLNRSSKDLQALMMQRKMAQQTLQPPDMAALETSRKLRMQEMQMEAVLKECIIYFFFVMVLFFISYQARDTDSFIYAQNIKNTFFINTPALSTVISPATFWAYMHKTLLPNLYSGPWYNGKELDWRERLQIDDRNTIRVGVARLRQQRIKEDTCVVREEFEPIIHHCRDHYSWSDDDTRDYLRGWEIPTSDNIRRQGIEACYMDDLDDDNMTSLHDQESPWVYRTSVELKNAPYPGQLTMYKGGGYTFTFKRAVEHTERLLKELEEYDWLGVRTRSIFIEFTLYNANINLFGSVIMLVEFMATGSAISKGVVKVFRLSSYVGGWGVVVIIFELTFLCFIVYFLQNILRRIKKERLKFFGEFWNVLEFAMLIFALVSIVMYAMKKVFGTVAINTLHESESGDYVNFVTISIWDELFGFILALVVFCATVKFIKMLKFNKRMSMLGDTIKIATRDLRNFSIVFFIYFFAFCMMAYVLYGKQLASYGTFAGCAETLFAFALGDFDFYEMQDVQPILGPLFFFLFVIIIYIAMMGMFLTIIYDSFAEVKRNAEHQSNDYEIVDFIWKRFKGVFGWS